MCARARGVKLRMSLKAQTDAYNSRLADSSHHLQFAAYGTCATVHHFA